VKYSASQIRKALSVYLVMGLDDVNGKSAIEIAQLALKGGITMLQLREKQRDIREVIEQGKKLRQLCDEYRVPFIVNDRVDIAIVLEADGIHVGQTDIPAVEVRKLIGNDAIIGVSAGTPTEAKRAMEEGADYLGVGSIYATSTKKDAGAPVGVEWVGEVRNIHDVPIVGIGGIHAKNASDVIRAGADGIAVVSAIIQHENPEKAARQLLQIVVSAKKI
jgi:thiamine-phosphate pyrophosphorylase